MEAKKRNFQNVAGLAQQSAFADVSGLMSGKSMATSEDIQGYIDCMEEIKQRWEINKEFVQKRRGTGNRITDAEFICLQFRKILELIALASLCAHREKYEKVRSSFRTDWNADRIFKIVEKINPEFYPEPCVETIDPMKKKIVKVDTKKAGFLTREEFKIVLNRTSEFLHAANPYSFKPADLDALWESFTEWHGKIFELLRIHIVHLLDEKRQYWVQMSVVEQGGKVVLHEMERVDP